MAKKGVVFNKIILRFSFGRADTKISHFDFCVPIVTTQTKGLILGASCNNSCGFGFCYIVNDFHGFISPLSCTSIIPHFNTFVNTFF